MRAVSIAFSVSGARGFARSLDAGDARFVSRSEFHPMREVGEVGGAGCSRVRQVPSREQVAEADLEHQLAERVAGRDINLAADEGSGIR